MKGVNIMVKKIGIDIDGVITHEGDAEDNIWHNAFCEYFGKDIERKKDVFNFIEAYDLSQKEVEDFLDKNIENIYKRVKPAPGARNTLCKLKESGVKILLITARDKKFQDLTLNWLDKYNIFFDKLIHEENKAPLAHNKNISLFIEDNKKNALQLLEYNIRVIIMDKYHNQNIEHKHKDKIFRAENWNQIRNYIFTSSNIKQ